MLQLPKTKYFPFLLSSLAFLQMGSSALLGQKTVVGVVKGAPGAPAAPAASPAPRGRAGGQIVRVIVDY